MEGRARGERKGKGWGWLVEAFVFVSMCPGHVDHDADHVALWGLTESFKKDEVIRDADVACEQV